jgi:hypoxanthine phosphoribosyltransferase
MTSPNKIINISQVELQGCVHRIIRGMSKDGWIPDYIVGITRGGLIPAVMLSQYLDIPMHTLNISFRDGEGGPESNLWMAEDAYGYVPYEGTELPVVRDPDRVTTDPAVRKRILIVDDINDTGRTLNWIKEDWPSGCLPNDPDWADIWHNTVRFATIVDNAASEFKDVDYTGLTINKLEEPSWVVFPWETWWE